MQRQTWCIQQRKNLKSNLFQHSLINFFNQTFFSTSKKTLYWDVFDKEKK